MARLKQQFTLQKDSLLKTNKSPRVATNIIDLRVRQVLPGLLSSPQLFFYYKEQLKPKVLSQTNNIIEALLKADLITDADIEATRAEFSEYYLHRGLVGAVYKGYDKECLVQLNESTRQRPNLRRQLTMYQNQQRAKQKGKHTASEKSADENNKRYQGEFEW